MKNKLLISSALASGIMFSGAALAQTTVSGNLDLHYKAISFDGTGTASRNGIGRESQLNIQNKGKLTNGWDYAAGFSLEFDGTAAGTAVGTNANVATCEKDSVSNENVYIDLIIGSTTLTTGIDHVQNSTFHATPFVQNVLDHVAAGPAGMSATDQIGAKTKESMYYGIVQAIPGTGINLSAIIAPQGGYNGGSDQTSGTVAATRNSSYEIGFIGNDSFGVKGLTLSAFKNVEKASNSVILTNVEGTSYGAAYNFGQFAVGFDIHKTNRSSTDATVETNMKNTMIGVTYAATKELTIGLVQSNNKIDAVVEKEKIKSLQLGYNLGPVVIAADYSVFDGIGGSNAATAEGKQLGVRLSTKF
jgi:hypothetical protein